MVAMALYFALSDSAHVRLTQRRPTGRCYHERLFPRDIVHALYPDSKPATAVVGGLQTHLARLVPAPITGEQSKDKEC